MRLHCSKPFTYLTHLILSIILTRQELLLSPFRGSETGTEKSKQLGRAGISEVNLSTLFLEAELRCERAVIRYQETV